MVTRVYGNGIYDIPPTSKSRGVTLGVVSQQRTPSDPIFSTKIKLVSLATGFPYHVKDKVASTLGSGSFSESPTYINNAPAYTETDDVTVYFIKYGYKYSASIFVLTRAETLLFMAQISNSYTTLSEAAAGALSGIAVDKPTKTITVSSSHSINNLYDYLQWFQAQTTNADILPDGEIFSTITGTGFTLKADWRLVFTAVPSGTWNITASDVTLGAVLNLSNFNLTGTLYFDIAGTYTFTDLEIDAVDTVDGTETVVVNPVNAVIPTNNDPVNITINAPVVAFAVSATPASAKVVIYATGTQTVLAEGTGSASYEWTAAGSVDYTVRADGYLPQRATGVALSDSTTAVELSEDKVYTASHGLTYGTGFSYNPATKVLTLTADNEGRNLYSCIAEYFNDHTNTAVRNEPFLMVAIGPDRIDLIKDMTITGTTYWKGAGMQWYATGDQVNPTHAFCSIKSVGTIAASAKCYYQQVDGSGATALTLSGSNKIDEIIQYWSDPNHDGSTIDGYDYSDHLVFKTFMDGYYQGRADVLDAYGVAALEPYEYTVALSNTATGLGTGTQGLTITVTDHTSLPIDPQTSGDFYDYKITELSAAATPEAILRQWVFDLYTDPTATYNGKQAFNWGDPVIESAGNYETRVVAVEGTSGVHGFYVEESGNYHPEFTRFQANDLSYWVVPVDTNFTINVNVTADLIQIFTTGTQTVLASGTATNTLVFAQSGETVDYVVQKKGYLPQRITGVTLSAGSTSVSLSSDPVYSASHGLTYGIDLSYNPATQRLTCLTRQAGRDFYSALIDAFVDQSALFNKPFYFQAVGIDSIFFLEGTELFDASSEDNWYDAGIRYVAVGGATAAEWCSIKSSGAIPAGVTGRYQYSDGSNTTALRTTGAVNQIIQIYGDASHGNFDRRGYLVIKFQANPYVDTRSDILALAGVSTLEPFEYSVSISPVALDVAAGDSGAVLTLVDHTLSPLVVGGKSFDYEIQDTGVNSAEDILRAWDYRIAQTGLYQGVDTFNLPEFVAQSGSNFETRRGIVEGSGGTLSGCYVSRAGADHPDFVRHQSNDGTYYVKPVLANASITNIVAGSRLQIVKDPTGTPVEVYNDVPGTNYTLAYTEGTTYTAGDVLRIRLTECNATTAQEPWETTVVATSSGWSAIAAQTANSIYAANGVDGTALGTLFTATFVPGGTQEINLVASSNFTAAQAYAFYCYQLSTANGIEYFFNGVDAPDTGNYKIVTSILDLKFDNETTKNIYQSDTARIYRDDDAYPVADPTTSGFGIDINWKNVVYVQNVGGSALTAAESAKLTAIDSKAAQLVFTKANELDVNVQSMNGAELLGSGTAGDKWRGA